MVNEKTRKGAGASKANAEDARPTMGSDTPKEEAGDSTATLKKQIAELRQQVESLTTAIPALQAAAQPKPATDLTSLMPALAALEDIADLRRQNAAKRTEDQLHAIERHIKKVNADLVEGERHYRCWIEGEPTMERIVGSADEVHARAKYQKYMGIISVLEVERQIQSLEVDESGNPLPQAEEEELAA